MLVSGEGALNGTGGLSSRHTLRLMVSGGVRRLEFGGHDITHGVQAVTVFADGLVQLDVLLIEVDVAVEGTRVTVPDRTRDTLITLGWQPPGESIITDEEPMRA